MLKHFLKQPNLLLKSALLAVSAGLIFSCTPKFTAKENRLSERDLVYQKGLTLFQISKYEEATPFFIKVVHQNQGPRDEIYSSSLWCLSVIYDSKGEYDKALISLIELEQRRPAEISAFKIQLSIAKNYYRLDNIKLALATLKAIEQSKPQERLGVAELYFSTLENVKFNFDQTLTEELIFLREAQKYLLYVMESGEPKLSAEASEVLQNLYLDFLKVTEKSQLDYGYRRKVAVQILDNLRGLDVYKLDDKMQLKPVNSFFTFSTKKQTELIDWLHQ